MLAGMRLVFGPDDDEEFSAARTVLLDRFEQWLGHGRLVAGNDPAEAAGDAGLALDWKWSYGDGDLGRWRIGDVGEFLLEWCPRKLSASPADSVSIPGALAAFVTFLDADGLLASGSSPAAALVDAAASLAGEFVAAMGDASNFGLAKSLFSAAGADGVDLSDPDRLQEWITEFNAGPEEERRRIIPDTALARPTRPALPPVAMPDDAEVTASEAAAPILTMFAAFAAFVGEGRKLTQTGNLTLADARALVSLLGTGDAMDEQIGDRTFKTKSSAELPRLRQLWAKKAGVVRVARGRVIVTKQGLAISRDPAGLFDRAIDALLAIGPLASQRDPNEILFPPTRPASTFRPVRHASRVRGPLLACVGLEDTMVPATPIVKTASRAPQGELARIRWATSVDSWSTSTTWPTTTSTSSPVTWSGCRADDRVSRRHARMDADDGRTAHRARPTAVHGRLRALAGQVAASHRGRSPRADLPERRHSGG